MVRCGHVRSLDLLQYSLLSQYDLFTTGELFLCYGEEKSVEHIVSQSPMQ